MSVRVLRILAGGFALAVAVPIGIGAGVASFFLAAYLTDSVVGLSVAAVATALLVSGLLAGAGARGVTTRERIRRVVPAAVAVATAALLFLGIAALTFRPMDVEYVAMEPTEDTYYWDLPTGSRIAYWHMAARGPAHAAPVIFLHGGPGAPGSLSPGKVGEMLAEAGFDVYDYHQVGSGLSGRLHDVSLYTVDRHVDDLEAIRRELGAERMILVGGSWGGTLASYYMARYPDRVERAVFPSPGAIWRPGLSDTDGPIPESEGAEVDVVADAVTVRFGVAYYLLQVNPRAAHNLAPDEEMSGFFQPLLAQIIADDVAPCPDAAGARDEPAPDEASAAARLPDGWVPAGYGFYAMMVTNASLERSDDPRGALRDVEAPILILRGECDRIRREVHEEYIEVFPEAELVVVEGAAHSVSASPHYPEILLRFLTEGLHADASVGQADTRAEPGSAHPALPGLTAFARAYGYVRFFHPSDEAAGVDWNRFAVDGARRFAVGVPRQELRATLERTFADIAPTVRFLKVAQEPERSDPPSGAGGRPGRDGSATFDAGVVAWQHLGVGVSSAPFYQSIRLERPERHGGSTMPAMLTQNVSVGEQAGREFQFRVRFRTVFHGIGGGAVPMLVVEREGGLQGYAHFPLAEPLRSDDWATHRIRGRFDDDAATLTVGLWGQGLGDAWFADPELLVRNEIGDWEPVEEFRRSLSESGQTPASGWTFQARDHELVPADGPEEHESGIHLAYRDPDRLFDAVPAPGEVHEADLVPGLRIRVPLAFAASPAGDGSPPPERGSNGATPSLDDPAVRVAGIMIAWNVLRHFYPYDDVVEVDWDRLLEEGLLSAMEARSVPEYLQSLERLLAGIDDGHARVVHPALARQVPLPFRLVMAEGQVVVEDAADTISFRPGDVLEEIDGVPALELVAERELHESGSPQFRRVRALSRLGLGESGSTVELRMRRGDESFSVSLVREAANVPIGRGEPLVQVESGIYYVDLRRIGLGSVVPHIQTLAEADGVILDSRGMPAQGTAAIFAHLTDRPLGWVSPCILKTIRPGVPGGAGCASLPENGGFPPPQSPRFQGRAVVLIDARAYSTAESYLARVEHTGAATLVGRPTAGANGNQNWLRLPGGERIFWTGMRVTRPDGSQHHVVGIRPEVEVERTLAGIREGRDEDLEAAVRLIREGMP